MILPPMVSVLWFGSLGVLDGSAVVWGAISRQLLLQVFNL